MKFTPFGIFLILIAFSTISQGTFVNPEEAAEILFMGQIHPNGKSYDEANPGVKVAVVNSQLNNLNRLYRLSRQVQTVAIVREGQNQDISGHLSASEQAINAEIRRAFGDLYFPLELDLLNYEHRRLLYTYDAARIAFAMDWVGDLIAGESEEISHRLQMHRDTVARSLTQNGPLSLKTLRDRLNADPIYRELKMDRREEFALDQARKYVENFKEESAGSVRVVIYYGEAHTFDVGPTPAAAKVVSASAAQESGETQDQLSSRGFPLQNTALVIIDMVHQSFMFTDPDTLAVLVEKQLQLIAAARKHGWPVIVVEDAHIRGSTLEPIMDALEGLPRVQVVKKWEDDVFEPARKRFGDPQEILHDWEVKNLVVMGVNGPYCVLCSAKSAIQHGFNVWTALDLVGDFRFSGTVYPGEAEWFQDTEIKIGQSCQGLFQKE